jgi:hypothetical protein
MSIIKTVSSDICINTFSRKREEMMNRIVGVISGFLSKERERPREIYYEATPLKIILLEFDFKRMLMEYVNNLGVEVLKDIFYPLDEVNTDNMVESFIDMELDSLFRETSNGKYFDRITLQDYDNIRILIDSFFSELLNHAKTRFGIYFLIGNMIFMIISIVLTM